LYETHSENVKLFHTVRRRTVELFSRSYKPKVTVSFVADVADVSDKQYAWEKSGKFEGDIVLPTSIYGPTYSALVNVDRRWKENTVPFYIDPEFRKYCSIKIESAMRGVEGNTHAC
jgi:hypothetical protein